MTADKITRSYNEAYELMMDDDWNGPFDTVCLECGVVALLYIDENEEQGIICAQTEGCINSYNDPRYYDGY